MCSREPRETKMAEGAATEKKVLVCLGERKRAVTFRSGGGNEVESLLESVKEVYKVGVPTKNLRTNNLDSTMLKSKNQVTLFVNYSCNSFYDFLSSENK